jgi:phage-related protein
VSFLWGAISGWFTSTKTNASNSISSMVSSVVNFLTGLPGKARSAVASLWSNMVGAFNSAKSSAISAGTALVNGTIGIVKTLPGKAGSALSSLKNSVLGAVKGAAGWLVSAGSDLIMGLIEGIKGAVGKAVGAVKDAMGNVVSGALDALGIGSPSKVMEMKVGRWLLPGVTKGAKKSLPKAKKAMGAIVHALVPAPRPWTPGRPGDDHPGAGMAGGVVTIGSVVLDASKMKDIQDVVELARSLSTTARTYQTSTTWA